MGVWASKCAKNNTSMRFAAHWVSHSPHIFAAALVQSALNGCVGSKEKIPRALCERAHKQIWKGFLAVKRKRKGIKIPSTSCSLARARGGYILVVPKMRRPLIHSFILSAPRLTSLCASAYLFIFGSWVSGGDIITTAWKARDTSLAN